MGAVELRNGATSFTVQQPLLLLLLSLLSLVSRATSVQQPLLLVLLLVSLATSFQQPFSAFVMAALLQFAKIPLFGVLVSSLALHMQAL